MYIGLSRGEALTAPNALLAASLVGAFALPRRAVLAFALAMRVATYVVLPWGGRYLSNSQNWAMHLDLTLLLALLTARAKPWLEPLSADDERDVLRVAAPTSRSLNSSCSYSYGPI